MPRTKVTKKTAQKQKQTEDDVENGKLLISQYRDMVRYSKTELLLRLQQTRKSLLEDVNRICIEEQRKISIKYMSLPLSEVRKLSSFKSAENPSMISKSCISKEDILNIAKNTTKKKRITRSSSFTDEGYLTTESTNSGSRKSRSRAPKSNSAVRATRSLSKTNSQKTATQKRISTQKTPINKATPPNSYGVVTPKCKPNTPLVFLRRPKVGEVALSMQGSPLLTANVVTEKTANINIPLSDGTLLSLQPQNGLRMSQIPDFDQNTLRELDCLRANLEKVFEVTKKRYNLKF